MNETLALVALMLWPAAPLFLVPLHLYVGFWRRVGVWSYAFFSVLWAVVASLVYLERDFLLRYSFGVGSLYYAGAVLLMGGMLLQGWASSVIGIRGTFGWWELFPLKDGAVAESGPYRYLKHPIYLAHTLMLAGVFFMTGVVSVGASAILDFLIANFVVKPLEEKELAERFGAAYSGYAKRRG